MIEEKANYLKAHNGMHFWQPVTHPADSRANPPRIICSAEGVRLRDIDGHNVLDAVAGLWNVNLGYSCSPIKEAMAKQSEILPYAASFKGSTHGPAIELSQLLVEWFAPIGMARAFFTSGGSDSVETALRLARQYHKLRGQKDRTKFLSLKKGYHGTHFGGASVNGNQVFRRNYEPLLPGCFHIPSPYTYRNPFDEEDPETLARLCARSLEDEILFQGADTIAALIVEPVLGAGGVIPPHPTFLPMVREVCKRHGILLIADEVISGFGRLGAQSGSELFGIKPDIMCVAKAITNGYFPLGAVLISEEFAAIFEASTGSDGMVGHGYTYSAHPIGAAAAIACLAEIKKAKVAENAARQGQKLLNGLVELKSQFQIVGDVRGQGLMLALELVSDRATKTTVSPDTMSSIYEAIYSEGVMVRINGNNIILSPPLVISDGNVDEILGALKTGLSRFN